MGGPLSKATQRHHATRRLPLYQPIPAMLVGSGGNHMAVESLTYAEIADRLGVTVNAARGLVKRLHLPRQTNNDRKVTTLIDFDEIQHRPQPTPPRLAGNYELGITKERLAHTEAELAAERERSRGCRADYEHERERADQLVTTVQQLTGELVAMRTEREVVTTRPRPWWRRLLRKSA
jgi:hypothetical protein